MAKPPVPGSKPGQKTLMKKLKASQARNTTARAKAKVQPKSGGTLSDRIKSVKADGGAKVNPSKYSRLEVKGGQVKSLGSTAAEGESAAGRVGSTMARGALRTAGRVAGPVGALVAMTKEANSGEQAWIDDKKNRGPLMKGNAVNPSKRVFGGTVSAPGKGDLKERVIKIENVTESRAAPKPKLRPASVSSGTTSSVAAPKPKARPTFAKPEKPLNEFERGKVRRYDDEGYRGRSMMGRDSKRQVIKERKYKTFG